MNIQVGKPVVFLINFLEKVKNDRKECLTARIWRVLRVLRSPVFGNAPAAQPEPENSVPNAVHQNPPEFPNVNVIIAAGNRKRVLNLRNSAPNADIPLATATFSNK